VVGEGGESEVGDLEVAVFVEEEVLRLEVTVVDAAAVAEVDGGYQLLEVESGDVLLQSTFGDLVEELSAAHELHGDVDLGLAGHDFVKLHDV